MLNKEVKRKWVDALRSGNYKQTTGYLKYGNSHCCLGVLCEVLGYKAGNHICTGDQAPDPGSHYYIFPKGTEESAYFAEDLGFDLPDGSDARPLLMKFNDADKLSFEEIADWIEENL